MRIGVWTVVAVVVGGAGVRFAQRNRAPLKKVLIWAVGRGQGCGLRDCLGEIGPQIGRAAREVRQASRVVEEDGQGNALHETPEGRFWSPQGNALYYNLGEMNLGIYTRHAGLKPGDVVLDCGANVGTFTRRALRAGVGKVVAFEIDPRNVECLRRNFQKEVEEGKVVIVGKGVWSEEGTVEVKTYSNTNLNTAVMGERLETREEPKVVSLPVTSIDRAVEELGLSRVDFVKMDVEGAEVRALKGAARTLKRWRPRLALATENLPDDVERVPRTVKEIVPEYRFRMGPCVRLKNFMIRPEVVYGWVE
jgi:FkbM family methyltransferase